MEKLGSNLEILPTCPGYVVPCLKTRWSGSWRRAWDLQSARPRPKSWLPNLVAKFHSPYFATVQTLSVCLVVCFLQANTTEFTERNCFWGLNAWSVLATLRSQKAVWQHGPVRGKTEHCLEEPNYTQGVSFTWQDPGLQWCVCVAKNIFQVRTWML